MAINANRGNQLGGDSTFCFIVEETRVNRQDACQFARSFKPSPSMAFQDVFFLVIDVTTTTTSTYDGK